MSDSYRFGERMIADIEVQCAADAVIRRKAGFLLQVIDRLNSVVADRVYLRAIGAACRVAVFSISSPEDKTR